MEHRAHTSWCYYKNGLKLLRNNLFLLLRNNRRFRADPRRSAKNADLVVGYCRHPKILGTCSVDYCSVVYKHFLYVSLLLKEISLLSRPRSGKFFYYISLFLKEISLLFRPRSGKFFYYISLFLKEISLLSRPRSGGRAAEIHQWETCLNANFSEWSWHI